MVGNSDSRTSTVTEEYIFNNADYGGGGESGSAALADNINLGNSELEIGDVTLTDQGAIEGGIDVAKTGITQSGESFKDLLNTSEKLVGDGYDALLGTQEFAKSALSDAIDTVSGSQQSVAAQLDRVLGYANQSTRSDASQTVENVGKYALIGGALLVGAYILKNRG